MYKQNFWEIGEEISISVLFQIQNFLVLLTLCCDTSFDMLSRRYRDNFTTLFPGEALARQFRPKKTTNQAAKPSPVLARQFHPKLLSKNPAISQPGVELPTLNHTKEIFDLQL